MFDNCSLLMKKLGKIMPPKIAHTPYLADNSMRMSVEYHPIRQSAKAFTHWLDDELPTNRDEVQALLWTFGEILCGQMESQLNHAMRAQVDLLATLPFTGAIVPGNDVEVPK